MTNITKSNVSVDTDNRYQLIRSIQDVISNYNSIFNIYLLIFGYTNVYILRIFTNITLSLFTLKYTFLSHILSAIIPNGKKEALFQLE